MSLSLSLARHCGTTPSDANQSNHPRISVKTRIFFEGSRVPAQEGDRSMKASRSVEKLPQAPIGRLGIAAVDWHQETPTANFAPALFRRPKSACRIGAHGGVPHRSTHTRPQSLRASVLSSDPHRGGSRDIRLSASRKRARATKRSGEGQRGLALRGDSMGSNGEHCVKVSLAG
jgi:hypothetical protein